MGSSIHACDLASALDQAPHVRVLSLDCFDTLIWRNTHTPSDVFADLGFCTRRQRRHAETEARQRAAAQGREEVRLKDIYEALSARQEAGVLNTRMRAELDAEARHAFAFAPTVALMRKAKAGGRKVIIVSDTYLRRRDLRELIARVAGEDVAGLIDEIYCSCDFGAPKTRGLFLHVLQTVGAPPGAILHLGDNLEADCEAPRRLGIDSLHFVPFGEGLEQRLRLEAAAARLLHVGPAPAPVLQPHRAQMALKGARQASEAEALGYGVLGPIFHAFDGWIRREAAELAARSQGRVRIAFLMRDGYLPLRVHDALRGPGDSPAVELEISRLTATSASLGARDDILRHIECWLGMSPELILRQCLFTPEESAVLIRDADAENHPLRLAEALRRPQLLERIGKRARAYGDRLVDYVRRATGAQPGDTLMLVDLGYNATVQNRIDGLLSDALGVHVAGRYLLLSELTLSGLDKRGLIEADRYDPSAVQALCAYISVVEQLCTAARGSVVDYGPDGPVRKDYGVKSRQSAVREAVQAACVRYALEAVEAQVRPPASADAEAERQAAAAVLARLLFLPSAAELDTLRSFEHDVNFGSDELIPLFDARLAREGLQRRGLFYLNSTRRMYLPGDIRGRGLPLSLSLFAQQRFQLELKYKDFCDDAISVPILVADGAQTSEARIEANPTHDGYYVAAIPIGDSRLAVAVLLGQQYEWVQIASASFCPVKAFFPGEEDELAGAPAAFTLGQMTGFSGGLVRAEGRDGFLLVPPPPRADDRQMLLTVVFRPIASWAAQAGDAPAGETVEAEADAVSEAAA